MVDRANLCDRSRADGDAVLDQLHAVHVARDGFGRGLLRGVLGKAGQHHGAVERFDVNACRIDILVVDEAALDRRGDAGVVDVGADGLLVAGDRATRSGEQGGCNDGGGEGAANDHGETSGGVNGCAGIPVRR